MTINSKFSNSSKDFDKKNENDNAFNKSINNDNDQKNISISNFLITKNIKIVTIIIKFSRNLINIFIIEKKKFNSSIKNRRSKYLN